MVQIDLLGGTEREAAGGLLPVRMASRVASRAFVQTAPMYSLTCAGSVHRRSFLRLSVRPVFGFSYENQQDPRSVPVLFGRHGLGGLPKLEGAIS
jgi:hypothetical protein